MEIRAVVEIELEAPSEDDVSDIVHGVWGEGDPGDTYTACIVVTDTREVDRFSDTGEFDALVREDTRWTMWEGWR